MINKLKYTPNISNHFYLFIINHNNHNNNNNNMYI